MRYGLDEIMKRFKKAIIKHNLIADEKGIMVGLSGGKDSAALLLALKKFQAVSKYKYKLSAGHIALGFANEDYAPLRLIAKAWMCPFLLKKQK